MADSAPPFYQIVKLRQARLFEEDSSPRVGTRRPRMDGPPGVLHLLYPDVESACQTWEKPRKFEGCRHSSPFPLIFPDYRLHGHRRVRPLPYVLTDSSPVPR